MREPTKFAVVTSVFIFATSVTSVVVADDARDSATSARVKTSIVGDDSIQARDIEVETKDGVVQLSGFVSSEEQRTAALLRARAVPGVAEVRNDLSIRDDARPAAKPVADTVIAARVRNTLRDAQLEDGSAVNVEVSKGVVQLSGFVNSSQEKARAGDLASAVEGVRDVENQIALTDESRQLKE
ncbi:MAG: BON domain-containing protein [Steroidobacter sp.]